MVKLEIRKEFIYQFQLNF